MWTSRVDPTQVCRSCGPPYGSGPGFPDPFEIHDPDQSSSNSRAWYLEGLPLGTESSLGAILPRVGQEPGRVLAKAAEPAASARLEAETEAARKLGAFGSPTIAVGEELFWGDDRLEEAVAWAAGRHPAQG